MIKENLEFSRTNLEINFDFLSPRTLILGHSALSTQPKETKRSKLLAYLYPYFDLATNFAYPSQDDKQRRVKP